MISKRGVGSCLSNRYSVFARGFLSLPFRSTGGVIFRGSVSFSGTISFEAAGCRDRDSVKLYFFCRYVTGGCLLAQAGDTGRVTRVVTDITVGFRKGREHLGCSGSFGG